MITQQSIPCPDCKTPIYFEPHRLVQGEQFSCSGCKASIGIAPSSRAEVADTMGKFDELKADLLKKKQS